MPNSRAVTTTIFVLVVSLLLSGPSTSSLHSAVPSVPGRAVPETARELGAGARTGNAFPPPAYGVTFVEAGLPSGAHWVAYLNGTTAALAVNDTVNSTSSSLTFYEPNGTYSYELSNESNYVPQVSSGNLTVNGSAISIPVTFGRVAISTGGLTSQELHVVIALLVVLGISWVGVTAWLAWKPTPKSLPSRPPED